MIPFEVYSHYSIQEAFCHIDDLVAKAGELKLPGLCLTDHNSVSGSIEFLDEINKWNKKNEHKIKPILGSSIDLKDERILVLAKNKTGFYDLIKLLNTRKLGRTDSLILICKDENQYLKYKNTWLGDILCMSETDDGSNKLIGSPVYYINKEDSIYQRIIICSKLQTTLKNIFSDIKQEDLHYIRFFDENKDFSLKSTWHSNNSVILKLVEEYSLSNKPNIPVLFDKPDDKLRDECRNGWKRLNLNKKLEPNPSLKDRYVQQIEEELTIFAEAGISNYMLIVQDFMNYARNQGCKVGVRGSAGGSLAGYLLGLSNVDPLLPDPILGFAEERCLLFSRFINKGRFGKDNTSLPDIDCDVAIHFRSKVISYLREKYGTARISHITTFNTMDGKGAIKEVFRILDPTSNSFAVANEITKNMVDTAKIQDVLEDLKEENPKYNVIQYCVDHIPKIKDYYGEFKEVFDIAIKLANTIKSKGKHAAGIVLSNDDLIDIAPISLDKDDMVVDFEMVSLEKFGLVKYDILGVAAYEKIEKIEEMINNKLLMPVIEEGLDDTE